MLLWQQNDDVMLLIKSISRRELLKRPTVSYIVHVDLKRLQSLKKIYKSVSEKNGFEYFATKNFNFNLS